LSAQAQDKILFVSTDEPAASNPGEFVINARKAFQDVAPPGTFVNRSSYLSGTASLTTDIANAKFLVIVAVSIPINQDRLNEIFAALQTRPDLTILAFVDGDPATPAAVVNLNAFLSGVNTVKPTGWTAITQTGDTGDPTAPLNMASLYAPSFISLPSIIGHKWGKLSPVPSDYALYTGSALSSPPPVTVDNAYGLFLPHQASNGGLGACLLLVSDTSQFSSLIAPQPSTSNAIAQTFYAASTNPNGACAQPAAGVPDLKPTLTGPGSLSPGSSASLTLTVSNVVNQADSTNGQVTVTLPTGMTVVPGSLPANCTPAAGNGSFTCTLGGITRSTSNSPVNFQVTTTNTFTNQPLTAEVTGVTGEVNTANNKTTLTIPAFAPSAAAVPTLGEWALMLLGLAMLGMAGYGIKRRV